MPPTIKAQKSLYCSGVCHAWCCRNLIFYFKGIIDKDTEQFFKLRGLVLNHDDGSVIVPIKCKWITNQNKCKLYSWRPESCRVFECQKLKEMPELHY